MLSKLYNALTDKQRTAIYEEMVEANYFLLECEQRKLKSLWQAASQLDQFRGSARKEMKTRLEILHEVVSELKEGLEDLTGREPLRAPSIREGIERMELFSKEITTEMQALQKELQVFWEGYNGKFREGILGLKNLQEKFQATGKKLWDRAEIEGVEEFSLEVGTETIEKMGNLYSLLSLLVDSFGRKPATIRRLNHWFK
ncbi:14112_t:CDS:2 [Racocetra persica]|uniref:14112_t:CDS:1 n=1 Tax=Racocetra persica TaxID=160502 RepID=A0ACA9QHK4_9GLOM|nr:14112_t:CDS:2 [Racocetra persica]